MRGKEFALILQVSSIILFVEFAVTKVYALNCYHCSTSKNPQGTCTAENQGEIGPCGKEDEKCYSLQLKGSDDIGRGCIEQGSVPHTYKKCGEFIPFGNSEAAMCVCDTDECNGKGGSGNRKALSSLIILQIVTLALLHFK